VNLLGPRAFEPPQSYMAYFTSSNEGSLSNQTDIASEILEKPEPPISILLHCGLANKVEKKLTAPSLMSFIETKNLLFCYGCDHSSNLLKGGRNGCFYPPFCTSFGGISAFKYPQPSC